MIDQLDKSLERWLRAAVPLAPGTGDLQFDQPERGWDARRPTPLVNLYLYSLRRSVTRAAAGSRVVTLEGAVARERAQPVIEARYLLSVWGGSAGVEHELLGRIVHLLSQWETIPDEYLSEGLRAVRPRPTLSLRPDEETSVTSLWAGLDVPPRPSVHVLVYTPLGVAAPAVSAPAPSSVHLSVARTNPPAAFLPRRRVLARPPQAEPRRPAVSIQDSGRATVATVDGSEGTDGV